MTKHASSQFTHTCTQVPSVTLRVANPTPEK